MKSDLELLSIILDNIIYGRNVTFICASPIDAEKLSKRLVSLYQKISGIPIIKNDYLKGESNGRKNERSNKETG